MFRLPGSSQYPSPTGSLRTAQRSTVGEIIRQAEQHIAERNFRLAQEALARAWRIDPGNPYIPAIVERIEILESLLRDSSTEESGRRPYRFPVTVGAGMSGRAGEGSASSDATPDEERRRVQRMTTVALSLLERGSVDSAFESFMKAYVLDPLNPAVLDCAASVIPAWEALHARTAERTAAAMRRWTDTPGAAAAEAQRIASTGMKQDRAGLPWSGPAPSHFPDT